MVCEMYRGAQQRPASHLFLAVSSCFGGCNSFKVRIGFVANEDVTRLLGLLFHPDRNCVSSAVCICLGGGEGGPCSLQDASCFWSPS